MFNNVTVIGSYDFPIFSTIVDDGKKNGGKCEIGGLLGGVFTVIMEQIAKSGIGCQLEKFDDIGTPDPKSGTYSFMIGALFKGTISFIAFPVYYPIHGDDGTILEVSPPFREDTMTMMSMYNVSRTSHSVDVTHMYYSFPWMLWLLLSLSFVTSTIVLSLGAGIRRIRHEIETRRRRRRRRQHRKKLKKYVNNGTWMTMIQAFLLQPSFSCRNLFEYLIIPSLLFLSFFTVTYINGNLSTDLVVIDEPVTISTYQEVIDGKKKVFLARQFPEWQTFASAEKGTIRQKLFQSAHFYDLDSFGFERVTRDTRTQDGVMLGRRALVDSMVLAMLQADGLTSMRGLRVVDDDAAKFTNVLIFNKKSNPVARIVVYDAVRKMFECGQLQHLYDITAEHVIGISYGGVYLSTIRKLTTKVEKEESELTPICLSNIYNMIHLYSILIAISFFTVLFESFYFNVNLYIHNQACP